MITTEKDTTGLVNSQEFTTRRLGIKASGWSHIASILRDQLYSDKILAPVREYSTNAMDAHVEKGIKDRPIVVKLPNSLSPTFCVRDFGFGMSEDKVWDIFANYGESTKRNTNEQVGMLGIGSKSAFAYGDSFLVVSFQGGFKTTYVLHVAGSKEGDIVKMGVDSTTEEDGIEIQIPVRKDDIKEFETRAEKFFRHWSVMPIFEGNTINIVPIENLHQGEGWFIPVKGNSSVVIMGNIAYAMDCHSLKFNQNGVSNTEQDLLRRLFNINVSFNVPIGAVDVAASRESLQYTDKTIKTIIELLRKTITELTDMVLLKFDNCKTNFEKKCLLTEYSEYDSPMYHLNYILQQPRFKNLTSAFNTDQSESKYGFRVCSFNKSRRGNRKVRGNKYNEYDIKCRNNIRYISWDSADKHPLNRISALIEQNNNHFGNKASMVYTIEVTDKTKFDKWKVENQFDIQLVQFASLPIVKTRDIYPSVARVKNSIVGNVKNGKKILTVAMDFKSINRYVYSDYFSMTPLVYPTDGNVKVPYVIIDHYKIKTRCAEEISPSIFVSECNTFMKMLNVKLPTVVAIRSSQVSKLDQKKFVPFMSFITDMISNNPALIQSVLNAKIVEALNRYKIELGGRILDRNLLNFMASKIDKIVDKTSVARLFLADLKSTLSLSTVDTHREFISFIENFTDIKDDSFVKTIDFIIKKLVKQGEEFLVTYPMVQLIDSYNLLHNAGKDIQNSLFDYINIVDSKGKLVKV